MRPAHRRCGWGGNGGAGAAVAGARARLAGSFLHVIKAGILILPDQNNVACAFHIFWLMAFGLSKCVTITNTFLFRRQRWHLLAVVLVEFAKLIWIAVEPKSPSKAARRTT
jgi:hypothetical protein